VEQEHDHLPTFIHSVEDRHADIGQQLCSSLPTLQKHLPARRLSQTAQNPKVNPHPAINISSPWFRVDLNKPTLIQSPPSQPALPSLGRCLHSGLQTAAEPSSFAGTPGLQEDPPGCCSWPADPPPPFSFLIWVAFSSSLRSKSSAPYLLFSSAGVSVHSGQSSLPNLGVESQICSRGLSPGSKQLSRPCSRGWMRTPHRVSVESSDA